MKLFTKIALTFTFIVGMIWENVTNNLDVYFVGMLVVGLITLSFIAARTQSVGVSR